MDNHKLTIKFANLLLFGWRTIVGEKYIPNSFDIDTYHIKGDLSPEEKFIVDRLRKKSTIVIMNAQTEILI